MESVPPIQVPESWPLKNIHIMVYYPIISHYCYIRQYIGLSIDIHWYNIYYPLIIIIIFLIYYIPLLLIYYIPIIHWLHPGWPVPTPGRFHLQATLVPRAGGASCISTVCGRSSVDRGVNRIYIYLCVYVYLYRDVYIVFIYPHLS